jgi:ABC-2 type transport system ATP-binding protein
MAAALEFEHVSKTYSTGMWNRRRIVALDDFSLHVQQGEIFGFLGPNGAGKTTAIHLAMGFMRPTSGRGTMLGRAFGHAATRRRVGFLPENVALYHRPAERLVEFYGALNGANGPDLARRTREVLELLELDAERTRNVGKFSRGMVQRVGLAQALVNDPELLILDEPTSALDPLGRIAVRELLVRERNRGKTVFLSSHMLSEIELICDRIAVLHKGRLLRVGSTSGLLESRDQLEIVAQGVPAGALPGAIANGGEVRVVVPRSQLREAVERIWMLGGEVLRVNPVRRSLEEVFVELTSEASRSATQEGHP